MLDPLRALHLLLRRWLGQMLDTLQSVHILQSRWCGDMRADVRPSAPLALVRAHAHLSLRLLFAPRVAARPKQPRQHAPVYTESSDNSTALSHQGGVAPSASRLPQLMERNTSAERLGPSFIIPTGASDIGPGKSIMGYTHPPHPPPEVSAFTLATVTLAVLVLVLLRDHPLLEELGAPPTPTPSPRLRLQLRPRQKLCSVASWRKTDKLENKSSKDDLIIVEYVPFLEISTILYQNIIYILWRLGNGIGPNHTGKNFEVPGTIVPVVPRTLPVAFG